MRIIEKNIDKIKALCHQHQVLRLFVFGSILTDDFKDSSDIDLLVEFSNVDLLNYADNYFDLKASLEDLLNRQVDLLEDQAVRNPYLRKSIDASKQMIYGQ